MVVEEHEENRYDEQTKSINGKKKEKKSDRIYFITWSDINSDCFEIIKSRECIVTTATRLKLLK